MKYRPVNPSGGLLALYNHAYLYVTIEGGGSVGSNFVLEGLPEYNPPKLSPVLWGVLVPHTFYVNPAGQVVNDVGAVADKDDHPFTDKDAGSVSGGIDRCYQWLALEALLLAYPAIVID